MDENDVRLPSRDHPDFARMDMVTYPSVEAVVAAVDAYDREHLAWAVESNRGAAEIRAKAAAAAGVFVNAEAEMASQAAFSTAARIAEGAGPQGERGIECDIPSVSGEPT